MFEINKLEITVRSVPHSMCQVERFIEMIIVNFQVPERLHIDLSLAIVYAANNALVNCNQNDPRKFAKFSAIKSRRKITIMVEDEGNGFDYMNPPHPLLSKAGQALTGREIYSLVAMVDEIRFVRRGAKLIMSFLLDE